MLVKDLFDPGIARPRSVERHHLFPKKYLASIGISGTRQVNAIGNMAFLDWSDNTAVSGSAPVDYLPKMTARMDSRQYERQAHWHALPVGWEQLDYAAFVAKRQTLIARVVREGFETIGGGRPVVSEQGIIDVIRGGESRTVEFKSTARWNVRAGKQDPVMEQVVVKTVCGFLNAEGGRLLIGVDDDGTAIGLEQDLATLGTKCNVDGFELFLRQLLERGLTTVTANTVQLRFHEMEARQICEVAVAASGRPVFVKPAKSSGSDSMGFWVRVGNSTRQLHGDDMVQYQNDHWG